MSVFKDLQTKLDDKEEITQPVFDKLNNVEEEIQATKILKDHIDELHIIAQGLLDYETLSGDEINDLIKGIKPSRDEFDDSNSSKPTPPKPSVPKTGSTTAPQPN